MNITVVSANKKEAVLEFASLDGKIRKRQKYNRATAAKVICANGLIQLEIIATGMSAIAPDDEDRFISKIQLMTHHQMMLLLFSAKVLISFASYLSIHIILSSSSRN